MKVILVSPYSTKLVGGIISWTKNIINYHKDHGGDVDLYLLNNDNAEQVIGNTNLFKRIKVGFSNYLPVCKGFKEKVKEVHFDIVHICTSASFGLIRDLLIVNEARKKRIKSVVHTHFGRIPQILKTKGWERSLFLRLIKKVDGVVVMDHASFNALYDMGFKNVYYLPNPLSSEVQQLVCKYDGLRREPRKIVFAGHVVGAKGVFELVEACRRINNVKVKLLGNVTEAGIREKLLSFAGENADSWLSIPGNKSLEDVIAEMMTCAVFVLPSYSEGFPNVIIESMACGCPIVATSVGAIPEMLAVNSDRPCGICVPVKDTNALRLAILDLIGDHNRAMAYSVNACNRVNEMYSMPKVWEQLVEVWNTLL